MNSPEELLEALTNGGKIVSTGTLSEEEIRIAFSENRVYVDKEGFGYVYVPIPPKVYMVEMTSIEGDLEDFLHSDIYKEFPEVFAHLLNK